MSILSPTRSASGRLLKATDDQLIGSYRELGNAKAVGIKFAMHDTSVIERLKKLGVDTRRKVRLALITCDACGISFHRPPDKVKRQNYCSRRCQGASKRGASHHNWKGGDLKRQCQRCGLGFEIERWRANHRPAKYCSDTCRAAAHQRYPEKIIGVRERCRARQARRRAGALIKTHSYEEWLDLLHRCKGRCVKCGKKRKLTRDHIIPLSKGGHDGIENIQPLCRPCNTRKFNHIETLL